MTKYNDTKTVKKDNDNSLKLSIDEVLEKLPVAYKEVYQDKVEISNYNQPGSYFYRLSEVEILEKIIDKALEAGLDPKQIRAFREGSDIHRSHFRDGNGPKHEYEESESGPKIKKPSVEMVDYVHPLIAEFIESLKARGCILEFLNADKTRAVNIDPEMKAIYIVTLRIQSTPNSDTENLNVFNSDIIIQVYPENVRVYNPSLPGKARKVEFDVKSTISSSGIHIGPVTDKDAVAALEQLGLVMDRNVALDVFRKAMGAFIKTGNAKVLDGIDAPGFYSDGKGGIYAVGYQVREVAQEEMKRTLEILNKIALLFPKSLRRFATVVRWSLSSPFSYYLKQNKIYPQHLMLYGMTGTSKTALLLLNHGIWGQWDPESSNHGFFVSGGETDTPARLGERLEQGTFSLIIDEGEGLFLKSDGRENVPVIGILKHALQSLISRQTSDRGKFQALASVGIATNVKPPRGAGPILSRMATFESTSAEQIHLSTGDKEHFQKLQNEFYPQLEPIGQYVASKILEDPSKLSSDFELIGESMLIEMYNYAGIQVPEWVNLRMNQTSIENIEMDVKEDTRVFLYKSNLEAFSRNIGRTGVLRTSTNGNDYPEYDERTNISAKEKIKIAIRQSLLPWQFYKNTSGLELVILTTSFAREISKIVGEAYNLQSIAELLGFEVRNSVRVGNTVQRAIVSNLSDYLEFLAPEEIGLDNLENESRIREDLRKIKFSEVTKEIPLKKEEKKNMNDNAEEEINDEKDIIIRSSESTQSRDPTHENLLDKENSAIFQGLQEASIGLEQNRARSIGESAEECKPQIESRSENILEPVLRLLIDCTYNSSKKYKSVKEIYDCSLNPKMTHSKIFSSLEELVKRGDVIKAGSTYAARMVLEGWV
jgi:hypothetical protein